jgi:hypothetical protein
LELPGPLCICTVGVFVCGGNGNRERKSSIVIVIKFWLMTILPVFIVTALLETEDRKYYLIKIYYVDINI